MGETRLQKLIAQAGRASRRAAEKLILERRVTVNGRIITELGAQADPDRDEIRVDQEILRFSAAKHYLLFYKPKKCVTTLSDPQGRKTVLDFVPNRGIRIFPVGRLDYDAEGLLLLTNDGALAHALQHPRFGVKKVYEVKVKGHPDASALDELRSGVILEEGKTSPAEVEVLRFLPRACWLRLVLHQGWYRQIKRMCEKVGHPVLKIKRIEYGPLHLIGLKPGSWRELTAGEVASLYRVSGASARETPASRD
jgi:23S rRNA pseudouridine2605 synthase